MRTTLVELETHWSLTDLQDAHATLDLIEDAETEAYLEAKAKR
jgi:hypothetical protein